MQCPSCGLYHPSRYEQCVSCGSKLSQEAQAQDMTVPAMDEEIHKKESRLRLKKANKGNRIQVGVPTGVGLLIAAGIFLAAAGGTYFFCSRPPESERLLQEGTKQLQEGQYAFAQKTLEHAVSLKPDDPKLVLTLARAYVGVDQMERAWSCITRAQQLGTGVMADPQLSSDLANYYRQKNQYQRAAELLRPLAAQNFPNKKTELADLDALWGDEAFRQGNTEQALKCWEEVKELQAGARLLEVDTRLSSIYQKMANEYTAKNDSEAALNYLAKLNALAPSIQSYEKASDLYAQQGKLDLAIDQLKRAIKSGSGSAELNNKLAGLIAKRGKELLDSGDSEGGYGYLQQAQSMDARIKLPSVTLRSVKITFDNGSGTVTATGEVWNPSSNSVNYLSLKADLFDTKNARIITSREQRVIDEFVQPLQEKDAKPFTISMNAPSAPDGSLELRLYLDGSLYKSYPLKTAGGKGQPAAAPSGLNAISAGKRTPAAAPTGPDSPRTEPEAPANKPEPAPSWAPEPGNGMTPEERTLKDLE